MTNAENESARERLRCLESAERTLLHERYTYHGGLLWKPPLSGKPPDFDLWDRQAYHKEFMQIVREKVEEFGSANQLNQVKEELAELIVAISHLERSREDAEINVSTELADVEFMLEQFKYILRRDYGFKPSSFVTQKYFSAGMRVSFSAFKPLDGDEAIVPIKQEDGE